MRTLASFARLVKEFDFAKNAPFTPADLSYGSARLAWWRCAVAADHVWQVSPNRRTKPRGASCPFCTGRQASSTNSLATQAPDAALLWDYRRNAPLTPDQVVGRSSRLVWWKCPNGSDHRWRAKVQAVAKLERGCPFCSGFRASITNSLASTNPALARQWHPTKNGKLTPKDVTPGADKHVWWKCPRGPDHEWQAYVFVRATAHKTGCPFCSGRRLSITNCLATGAPELAREWDNRRNGKLTPKDVLPASRHRVWWRCPDDDSHVWRTSVGQRRHGSGCPQCAYRPARARSLAALSPMTARLWHPQRNRPLTPKLVGRSAERVVWWKCPKGTDHEWQAVVTVMVRAKAPCPFCAGRRGSLSNCLAVVDVDVSKTWHPTRNSPLTPSEVTAGSRQPFWWMCAAGHPWRASVRDQVRRRGRCPTCGRTPAPPRAIAKTRGKAGHRALSTTRS